MLDGEASVDFNFAGRSQISGRLLAGSRPLRRVMVSAVPQVSRRPSAFDVSGADGRYEILGLADGDYELRAQLGWRGTERSFDLAVIPDTTYDIHLGSFARSGALTRGAELPRRLANWVVQARLIRASGEPVIFRDFTDSRGVCHFDGLEKGAYSVSFASPYFDGIREVVVEGSSVEKVDIRPQRSDTREVRVVDADSNKALN